MCLITDELDSYMYQTVGHGSIALYAEAMELPLYRATIRGSACASDREYLPTEGDEVEDLHRLLAKVKVGGPRYCRVASGSRGGGVKI